MSCPIYRIIQFKEALAVNTIQLLSVDDQDMTSTCLFAWSTDGVCWTMWAGYDQFLLITGKLSSDFYLRVRFSGGLGGVYIGGLRTDCYNILPDTINPFTQNFCDNTNLFQPYNNLDCALQLQQQMADSIVCMFGIPIYYIRVIPESNSADYTFKEFSLHNVESIKQIKLVIPDGTMPSSNPKLSDFDFDWESDWETEIGKTQFATAFGDKAFPKQRDLIYIPMMKRMWEVNSAYDEKNEGLMWRSTTWKLALVKYNEKTNVDTGDYSDIIDNWLTNKYEDVIGEPERNEQVRESGQEQIEKPNFSANNLYDIFEQDAIRRSMTKDTISIISKPYCHNNNVLARSIYKFKASDSTIVYQHQSCGGDGTLMMLLETCGIKTQFDEKVLIKIGEMKVYLKYNNGFNLRLGNINIPLDLQATYMVIIRWNSANMTTDMYAYPYKHRENIPAYLLKPEMYWFDFENGTGGTDLYNDSCLVKSDCCVMGYPLIMSNIKYFNTVLDNKTMFKEAIKFTTDNESCVFADLARPLTSGHGYDAR